MAIVITNGTYYIRYTDTGATKKTSNINNAYQFSSIDEAIKGMKKAKKKTSGYIVLDTLTNRALWKWMTPQEIVEAKERKNRGLAHCLGKVNRKSYSKDTRKLIYLHAGGRCELCGRKILLDDMTIDHIIPLSKGGEDDVENLSCTCYPCNLFKGNILPDDFMERVTEIFMYQTEKKSHGLKWKILHRLLESLI